MKQHAQNLPAVIASAAPRFQIAVCALLLLGATIPSQAAVVFADNFNLPGPVNLDGSDQTGRRLGLLANDVVTRSALQQHTIVSEDLRMNRGTPGSTRVRFHDGNNLGNRWDFSSGVAGQALLDSRGFTVIFDYTPASTSSSNWLSWNVGIDPVGAGPGTRVEHSQTDFGILFRDNGGTQVFDNGVAGVGNGFSNSAGPRHVIIDFTTDSWADGANVSVNASVDGTSVLTNYLF